MKTKITAALGLTGTIALAVVLWPMPAQATPLTAPAGTRQAALKWNAVSGMVSDSVFRATGVNGPWGWPVKTGLSASSVTYTDTGLVSGKVYYYKVGAVAKRRWCRLSAVAGVKPK